MPIKHLKQQDLSQGQDSSPANADANDDANANADAGSSTIALPGLRPGELKMKSDRGIYRKISVKSD